MKFYQSTLLNKFPNLTHCFTTKRGGVRVGVYSSLNLAFHVEDDIELVNTNHLLLAERLNYDRKTLCRKCRCKFCTYWIFHISNNSHFI